MTREEAIAYFKRHIDLYCVTGICREAEEMAIQALEQTQWIPVSERLPEENGEYLVTRKSPVYEYVDIVKKTNIFCSGDIASDIIAWQPLPEPYKGE